MSKIKFNIASESGVPTSVAVFIGSESFTATPDNPRFTEICELLTSGNADAQHIKGLLVPVVGLSDKMSRLSERVMVNRTGLYFDGDKLDGDLSSVIVDLVAAGSDYGPAVNFLEKAMTNPLASEKTSRLWKWLSNRSFTIHPDGDIIGYKSVASTSDPDIFMSITAGQAFVNGVEHKGRIPTSPGTVVEMPRTVVDSNGRVECSVGLHVGTFGYAKSFSGDTMLRVKVNPRDVVAVPEYDHTKMRVCRYRVLGKVTSEAQELIDTEKHDMRTVAVDHEQTAEAVGSKIVKPERKKTTATKATKKGTPATKAGTKAKAEKPQPKATATVAKKQGSRATAKATAKATPKVPKTPRYYDDFLPEHWQYVDEKTLRWLGKDCEIKDYNSLSRTVLIGKLISWFKANNALRAKEQAAKKGGK